MTPWEMSAEGEARLADWNKTPERRPMNEETRKLRDSEAVWLDYKKQVGLDDNDRHIAANFTVSDMKSAIGLGADWGYAQAKREAQGEIEALCKERNEWKFETLTLRQAAANLQSQLAEERARGEKMREALKSVRLNYMREHLNSTSCDNCGSKVYEALASYEGGSK